MLHSLIAAFSPPSYASAVNGPGDEHPAVTAVRRRLDRHGDRDPVSLVGFSVRGDVAAVVVAAGWTLYPVIVSLVNGVWVVPELINGTGTGQGLQTPRQERTADPPKLMWDSMSSFGPPGPDGGPPAEAWTILIGQAALDGEQLTVESDLEVQSCGVGHNGFVLVLFRRSWRYRPRLTMRTTFGSIVPLFGGQPGHPR